MYSKPCSICKRECHKPIKTITFYVHCCKPESEKIEVCMNTIYSNPNNI